MNIPHTFPRGEAQNVTCGILVLAFYNILQPSNVT